MIEIDKIITGNNNLLTKSKLNKIKNSIRPGVFIEKLKINYNSAISNDLIFINNLTGSTLNFNNSVYSITHNFKNLFVSGEDFVYKINTNPLESLAISLPGHNTKIINSNNFVWVLNKYNKSLVKINPTIFSTVNTYTFSSVNEVYDICTDNFNIYITCSNKVIKRLNIDSENITDINLPIEPGLILFNKNFIFTNGIKIYTSDLSIEPMLYIDSTSNQFIDISFIAHQNIIHLYSPFISYYFNLNTNDVSIDYLNLRLVKSHPLKASLIYADNNTLQFTMPEMINQPKVLSFFITDYTFDDKYIYAVGSNQLVRLTLF